MTTLQLAIIGGAFAISLFIVLVAFIVNRLRYWRARRARSAAPRQQRRTLDSEWVGLTPQPPPRSGIIFPDV